MNKNIIWILICLIIIAVPIIITLLSKSSEEMVIEKFFTLIKSKANFKADEQKKQIDEILSPEMNDLLNRFPYYKMGQWTIIDYEKDPININNKIFEINCLFRGVLGDKINHRVQLILNDKNKIIDSYNLIIQHKDYDIVRDSLFTDLEYYDFLKTLKNKVILENLVWAKEIVNKRIKSTAVIINKS